MRARSQLTHLLRRCGTRAALALTLALTTLVLAPAATAQFNGPGPAVAANVPSSDVTTDRAVLFPVAHDPVLSVGDLVSLRVFEQADYIPVVRIGADGEVLLPLIGTVALKGLTVSEAERLIEQRLRAAQIYVDPQVTLQIVEGPNQVATVTGELHGVVPIIGARRLFDVLAAAGGIPPTASHVITISRPGVAKPIVVDLGTDPLRSELANIPIFAGDTIIVSRIGVVYIVGAFKTPGAIPLNQYSPLTLMQATALSGGVNFEGAYGDLRLIRTEGDHRIVVKLNIQKILKGKAPDPILQANDVLFLPNNVLKYSISNGSIGTLMGITSLLISVIRY